MRFLDPTTVFVSDRRLLGGPSIALEWGRLISAIAVVIWLTTPAIGFLRALELMTVIGFVAAVFGFARPSLGLIGLSLVCTLDPLTRQFLAGGLVRWNTFNYLLLVVMLTSAMFVVRLGDPHSRLLKALLALMLAELVISPSLTNGVQHLLGAVTMFGLLVYFAQARDDADSLYSVGLVNGLVTAVGSLFFYINQSSLPEINPNVFAFFPETGLFCICFGFRAAARQKSGQLILGVLAVMNFAWVFLSGSRGGLAIAAVCLLFVLFSVRGVKQRLGFVAAAGVMAFLASNVFADLQGYSLHRITKLLDDDQSAAARTSGRSDLARAGIHMATLHPFGVGTGGFAPTWASLGFLPGMSSFKRGEEFQAHSGWIKVLAENGWPGFLLMAAYVGSFAYYGMRSRVPGGRGLGLLTFAALTVAFLSTEFQGKGFWLLAAGTTAALHPAEMVRCLRIDARRFAVRPRRVGVTAAVIGKDDTPGQAERLAL